MFPAQRVRHPAHVSIGLVVRLWGAWLMWLFEARKRYRLRVLNYTATYGIGWSRHWVGPRQLANSRHWVLAALGRTKTTGQHYLTMMQ
jgi:hypothetical protein